MYVVLRVSEPSVPGFGLLGINRQQLVLVDCSSQVGRAPGEGGQVPPTPAPQSFWGAEPGHLSICRHSAAPSHCRMCSSSVC